MRIVKYAAIALAAVVLLLVLGVAILAATIDLNDYRPQIIQLVKERTGRDLTIGDIGLKLFPKIGAQLKQVSLAARGGGGEFAGVDQAQVYVALLPLLTRQVVVDEIRVDGLRANLVKHADGTTNFDDLLKPGGEAPATPEPKAEPRKPVRLDVKGIAVTNARIAWKDESSGNDATVNLAELTTGRVTENRPIDLRLVADVQGAQPKLAVHTQLTGTLDFDLKEQRFGLTGMRLSLNGAALDFTGIDVSASADVQSAAQRISVSKLALTGKAARGSDRYDVKLDAPTLESSGQALRIEGLTLTASGNVAGMQLTDSTLKVPALNANLGESRLLLERLTLAARAKTASDALTVELSAPKLDLTPAQATGESAVLSAKVDGPQRKGDVSLRLAGVEGSSKALRIGTLTLAVDLQQQDNAIKGELKTPLTGNLETRVFELPKLAGAFTVTSSAIPQKTVQVPLNGAVRADVGKQRVAADLTTRFDESNIKAKAGVNGFAKPAYDFDVAIDKLNVDRYLSPQPKSAARGGEEKAAGGQPQKPGAGAEPEKPIDLSALKPLNLAGSLRVGQLQANNVKASNVRMDLRARDGHLTVDPLAANLYQGAAKGSLSVDANANRFVIKQNLAGVAIGPLLRDAADKDILEGKGSVLLDITTHGNVVSALKQALNGSARIELRDGAVKGVDLAGAVRRVKAAFGAGDVEGSGGAKQQTDFSELTASFAVKNGIAHNEDLNLKSPFLRVTGSGDVNIPRGTLDYVVKTAVVGTMAGQGGRDVAELKGLTIPVRLSGPFDQLKYKVELSQMARAASKEQLEAGREALKGAAQEKLQELLGGKREKAPAEGQATGDQAQPAAPKRREDQVKDALKGLLR
jgi:AsmA protein